MRTTGWRKIATAVWGWPRDPQIYGRIEIDATPILDAMSKVRAQTGTRVTVTHVVAKAVAIALRENPQINTRLVWGRFLPRRSVDIFVIVSTGQGNDLSGVKIEHADSKSVADIARELERGATDARNGSVEIERAKRMLTGLPFWALRVALRVAAFLTIDMGMDLRGLGMPREAFGSAMVSSVGMFGIPEGWAPLSPLYRVPLLVLIGEVTETARAVQGTVVARPVVPITATIDHRWVDGEAIASLLRSFCRYLADPMKEEAIEIVLEPSETPPTVSAPMAGAREVRQGSANRRSRTRRPV